MRKLLNCVIIGILMVSTSFGATPPKATPSAPVVTIDGAAEIVPYGEMVLLSIKVDKEPEDVSSVVYDWKIYDKNKAKQRVYVSNDKKTVLFAGGIKPAKFLVVLDAVYTFNVKDDKGIIIGSKTITTGIIDTEVIVGGETPAPDPDNPTPIPPAPKPYPNSPLGLVKPTVDAVAAMKSPTKAAVAKSMSKVWLDVKNKIAGQEITDLKSAYAEIQANSPDAITKNNGDEAEWQVWDTINRKAVYALYLDKKLGQLTDYIGAFAEIADALEYAGEQK